jgi:hypothetical protein
MIPWTEWTTIRTVTDSEGGLDVPGRAPRSTRAPIRSSASWSRNICLSSGWLTSKEVGRWANEMIRSADFWPGPPNRELAIARNPNHPNP